MVFAALDYWCADAVALRTGPCGATRCTASSSGGSSTPGTRRPAPLAWAADEDDPAAPSTQRMVLDAVRQVLAG
jgi:hypothetical protein